MCYLVKLCVLLLSLPCVSGITKSFIINLHTSPLTWNEAYENCKRQGRSLLQINHHGKQLVLQDIITKWKTENSLSETPWTGGFYYTGADSNVNGYYWSDCTAMVNHTNWVSGWTHDTHDKCVHGNLEDFAWSTSLCSQQLPYMSELSTGDCYFEERGDQILSEPNLVDFSPATETACRTKCLNYSLNGNDCQAYSGNGSMCLIMVSPYIHLNSFVPSVTFNAPGVKTAIKRCYTTGKDDITPNFSPPIPISTTPNATCSPTDPYPTQPGKGTTEITTTIKSTSYPYPSTSGETSTTNQGTTGTTNQGTTDFETTSTTSTTNQDTSITTTQDNTSTMNQDITSTAHQDTTSATTQGTTTTTNQRTTSTKSQDTTSTTTQNPTITTNHDTTGTTNQDTTSTTNQDTTSTANQDTTNTINQETTSSTITEANASTKKETTFTDSTHEPNCTTIQETMPESNNMIILFVLQCNCKTIDNSSLESAEYQFLLINRLQLSSNRRKLTSASDERISAISLGALGISVLILTFLVFVFSDIETFLRKNS